MLYVGIDPGLDGAIAWANGDGTHAVVTPTLKTGKGNKRGYDEPEMLRLLLAGCESDPTPDGLVVIERQQAYPHQGGVSNYSIGLGYGIWRGLLTGLGMSRQDVHPKTWQKVFGISSRVGDTKAQSIVQAKQLFPDVSLKATERCRKDHDGLSDALLLLEYGRRLRGEDGE